MEFQFDDRPAPGDIREVLPGIRWLSHPLPFALDHVNCWLIGDGANLTLIDTGVADAATRSRWRSLIDAEGLPERLFVTHHHPDHIGLAGWFAEQGTRLVAGAREVELARSLWEAELDAYSVTLAEWYRRHGLAERHVGEAARLGHGYRRLVVAPPAEWSMVEPGTTIDLATRRFELRLGRGHSPAMLMLYDRADGVLIAADQVLPSISPNVSLLPRLPVVDPLAEFLASLDELMCLPPDTLVLPSHGRPFRGLHARIEVLKQHHDARLDALLAALAQPRTAVELFPLLYARPLDDQQMGFALGEALAHLAHLEMRGLVVRRTGAERTRFVRL